MKDTRSRKYLILAPAFVPDPGGIEEYMYNFAKCMPGEVTVLTLPPTQSHSKTGAFKELSRFSIHRIPSRPGSFLSKLNFFFKAAALQKKNKFDLVICGHLHLGNAALLLKKFFRLKYLLILHGVELTRLGVIEPLKRYRNIIENARKILVVSNFTKEELIKRYPTAKNIEVVPPMLNEEFINKQRIDPDFKERIGLAGKKVILTVGRMTRWEGHKGHDLVLMALDKVFERHPEAVYVIVGEGEGCEHLKEFALKLNLGDKVVFHNYDRETVHNYYNHCDLFIMPSRFEKLTGNVEGFGIVFMEAAIFAKPCIGGRSGGIPDVIIDGETGILVNPNDPNDIAKAINRLLDDPEYARKLGQAAQQRIYREFSQEKLEPRIVKILTESCGL